MKNPGPSLETINLSLAVKHLPCNLRTSVQILSPLIISQIGMVVIGNAKTQEAEPGAPRGSWLARLPAVSKL